ncbi:MAG: hypothetical protein J6T55_03835, partial [Alphaproteobacteria bacterium]|nr:hypothetical protein [Alphaproteobacteria bacterium]
CGADQMCQECEVEATSCTTNQQCTGVCAGCNTETNTCQYMCEPVEYLQSNGNQYIDTDYVPNNNSVVEYDFEPLSITIARFMFGVWGNTNTKGRMYIYTGGGTGPIQYGFGVGTSVAGVNYINSNVQMSLQRHLCVMDKTSLTYDGTALTTGLSGDMTGNTAKFWIGKCNDLNGRATDPTKIYSCKITDNGTLVRNFLPVLAPKKEGTGQEPAMFDKVNNKIYYNAGTGTFKTNLD